VPYSCYVKDENEFDKRYENFHKTFSYFYCRDLKKDGITKVRALVQRVLSAVNKKYPNLPASKYFSIYESFSFTVKGVTHYPDRGVGLGMSSAITTILQAAILKITLEDLYNSNRSTSGVIGGLFYHDDTEIGFTHESDFHEFDEVEDIVMSRYGQIKNKKKSFFGNQGVLCERYSGKYNQKNSMIRYMLTLPFAAVNITHAKNIWIQGFHHFTREEWLPYLNKLVAYWGYEFIPNEIEYPASFGGWIPSRFSQVDTSFVNLSSANTNLYPLQHASRLWELPFKGKRSDNTIYHSPFNQLYPDLNFGGLDRVYLNNMSYRDMSKMFKSKDKFGSTKNFWTYNFNKRNETWNNLKNVHLPIDFVYEDYCNLHNSKDVLPPRELISNSGIDLYSLEEGFEYHSTANPRLGYLSFLNPGKLSDKIVPVPIPPGTSLFGKKGLTSQERRDFIDLQFSNSDEDFFGIEFRIPTFLIKTDEWFDPNSVIGANQNYYGLYQLPKGVIKKKSLSGIFEMSNTIWNILHSKHFSLYSKIISLIGLKRTLDLDFEILWDELLNKQIQKDNIKRQEIIDRLNENMAINKNSSENNDDDSYYPESYGGWSDTPLKDDDYFYWLTNKNQKPHKDWRYGYFDSIYQKYNQLNMSWQFGDSLATKDKERDPAYKLTEVEKHLYIKSGGQVDQDDFPIISTNQDFFDPDGDSSEGGMGDLFDLG